MTATLSQLALLLFLASLVAIVTRRLALPLSVGLLLAGVGVALLPAPPPLPLSPQLLYGVLLPPLLFEAALAIRWDALRRELPLLGLFATLGVLLAAAVTALGMHLLAAWPWPTALAFGTLTAATDPVAVIAALRHARVRGRLKLLVEAESLLNDGTAAVAFGAVLTATLHPGQTPQLGAVLFDLLRMTIGGLAVGLALGAALLTLARRSEDHLVALTLSVLAAFGPFWLAEHLGVSGVLATLAAGLWLGNRGLEQQLSHRSSAAVREFWSFAAFVSNLLVFLFMGLHLGSLRAGALGPLALLAVALVLAGRTLTVYPLALLFGRTRLRLPLADQHVLVWGGLRGALGLALALTLPDSFPGCEAIRAMTFAVVGFSVLVQGLTVGRVVGKVSGIDI